MIWAVSGTSLAVQAALLTFIVAVSAVKAVCASQHWLLRAGPGVLLLPTWT